MAQLTYNSINKFRYCKEDDEIETVESQEESLRGKLLKEILFRQLNLKFELKNCQNLKEKFVVSSKQESFTNLNEGLISNECFKHMCKHQDVRDTLISCGLSSTEVEILLNENKIGNCSEEAYSQRLKNIEQKLLCREASLQSTSEEHFAEALKLNRHEYEEECSKVYSEKVGKFSNLIKFEPYNDPLLPEEHPINNIVQLEKQLFPDIKSESSSKRKLSINKQISQIKCFSKKPKTLWDMKDRPVILPNEDLGLEKVCINNNNNQNCIQVISNNDSVASINFSKPFIWTVNSDELVPISDMKNNCVPIEEIKSNPKFRNFSPGNPSPTLYIKNLPPNLNPFNIVSLFGNFEEENGSKIQYRILKGKMKGQAFVKFKKTEVSKKAFSICNGYIIQNKPIVIEYGKIALKGV